MDSSLFYKLFVVIFMIRGSFSQRQPRCEQGSCYPATGDLLIGRENNLTASSTCGLTRPENYCIVSHLEEDTKCFTCDSRQPWSEYQRNSHRVNNIVSSFRERKLRWWQAENGKQFVSIQLDLEAEFHFTHLIMRFRTFRPKALLIERSYDFGKTWKVYRYFAQRCEDSWPGVKRWPPRDLKEVICDDRYSDEVPSTEGEVIFRVLPPFIRIENPYNEEVQDLLKLTNLRVNFTELHGLGDTLLDNRQEIKDKYYYAMYDMTVRGSCSCYGHASRCEPVDGYNNRPDMVHGQCVCTHNTKGRNCEQCQDFYNDLPWRPARQNASNACKKCNCNGHSDRCKFDPAVYEANGGISGGVCLDCQHNTMGRNCQQCTDMFYQDPYQDIRSSTICKPCDCDPSGSLLGGRCDDHSDERNGLVAGRCHCKDHVEGKRCDTCKDGFYNLDESNQQGCEACDCSMIGTVTNSSCDKDSGMCLCKRYVTGERCDTCYHGFYGLSDIDTGCTPCDCDVGGSISEACDQTTGACTCKPNIIGKQCNEPRPGYYYAMLDYLLYEAELAKGFGQARQYIQEPYADGYQPWTGPGYMLVREGDSLEFSIDNIEFPTNYDIVIRYDLRMPEVWEDVKVTIRRDKIPDENGPCANHLPRDDDKSTTLNQGSRYVEVTPSACLEPNTNYTIRLDFRRYKSGLSTPDATALIDSIVLVPATDSIPIFQVFGYLNFMKNEFLRYRCREKQLTPYRPNYPEFCKKLTFSISTSMLHRALPCECDPTGSLNSECEPAGGQCLCKPNVVGRKCDRCAPGTYNFGPAGCSACNCHEYGSRDNLCDAQTGQCLCIYNVGSRDCSQCEAGYWGFPQCRACDCNGNAETCDDLTGRCIACLNNTAGDHCESCDAGYYGDPRSYVRKPCRPCMCPGGPTSLTQHADSCSEDPRQEVIICNCLPGYQGPNCDTCAENYFGNPLVANSTCEPCLCNNNIDPNVDGSCDTSSGECLKCLFNTEGFSCEKCKPGYYGDATTQSCVECVCDPYGTDRSAGSCDRETGQCPCLPNVTGLRCDACLAGYWNITSGEGCSACGCDPEGSLGITCNQFDGQCDCQQERGGRDCSQCEDLYWGKPKVQCTACDCNGQGSADMQCDRRTGQCVCLTGISGYKCDRCDRGTTGELPNCKPCGECFDNWDRVIRDLRDQTQYLVNEALKIKATGVEKAFEKEFAEMENNIQEIRDIIRNANVSSNDIRDIEMNLKQLRESLNISYTDLERTKEEIDVRSNSIRQGNNDIRALQMGVDKLKQKIENLKRNATNVQAQDVEGAFNLTKKAQEVSMAAQRKVDATDIILEQSETTRKEVNAMVESQHQEFDRKVAENSKNLKEVTDQINGLGDKITDINEMVCDKRGEPCHSVCGGGGCGVCGGEQSCGDGAVKKAENALDLARQAEELLKIKERNATELLQKLQNSQRGAEMGKDEAQMAYNEALKAKNQTEYARTALQDLFVRISGFLSADGATPNDIKSIAEEVLAMSISLTPDQILDLAQKINITIQGLQNIDDILAETSSDLARAKGLKDRAETAEADAKSILEKAEDVQANLKGATDAQQAAQVAIAQADKDIGDAEQDLTQIESETAAATDKSNQSLTSLGYLRARLQELKEKYIENEQRVDNAEMAAQEANKLALRAEEAANQLQNKYTTTAQDLNSRYNLTTQAQSRAETLKRRADKLATDTTAKLKKLKDMQENFNANEKRLNKLSTDIDELNRRMAEYLQAINDKATNYYNCKT